MSYATQADIAVLRPDLDEGAADYSDQLAQASADVLERIRSEWWVRAVREKYGVSDSRMNFGQIVAMFDVTKLNAVPLKNLTCYRAMSRYIYPTMTRDTDDGNDAFTRRAERYAVFYAEEWEQVSKLPLYDFDGDAQFAQFERVPRARTVRVRRA